jgi:hypothetical protein
MESCKGLYGGISRLGDARGNYQKQNLKQPSDRRGCFDSTTSIQAARAMAQMSKICCMGSISAVEFKFSVNLSVESLLLNKAARKNENFTYLVTFLNYQRFRIMPRKLRSLI